MTAEQTTNTREIKLRAWDRSNKCWFVKDAVYLDEEGEVYILVRGAASDYLSRMDFDIVFYTGLKDKNNKEIYEGDIVTFIDAQDKSTESGYDWEDIQLIGKIEWSDERMGWHLTNRESIEMDEIEFEEVEIIGNIYEYPHLLK